MFCPPSPFVRQDYSEFFRVGPADEYGRNDAAKLGFFTVEIYEQGHVVHVVRTGGATLRPEQPATPISRRLLARHTRQQHNAPFGVHLRHPWAEITAIPATGGADEFARKEARNDYALLALWEMGIRKLRVPLQDLADPATRARMSILREMGHEFTVYTYGVPEGDLRQALVENAGLVAYWEVVFNWQKLDEVAAAIQSVRQEAPLRVLLSKLRSQEEDGPAQPGSLYFHNIRHGFRPQEEELFDTLQAHAGAAARGLKASVELRMVGEDPAQPFVDDLDNANRVAEALVAAVALRQVDVFADTLADIDRSYFVHSGLVDRRYTPRLAGRVVRNLYAELGADDVVMALEDAHAVEGGQIFVLRRESKTLLLVLPHPEMTVYTLPGGLDLSGERGRGRWIELESGAVTPVEWRRDAVTGQVRLSQAASCSVPTLLMLGQ